MVSCMFTSALLVCVCEDDVWGGSRGAKNPIVGSVG